MSFWMAAAKLSLRIPFSGSLKDRRQVVRSLTEGVRGRFSISAADLGPEGVLNAAELGFAAAGSSRAELEERMRNLENFLYQREDDGEFSVTDFSMEVFDYDDLSYRQDK